jgi:chromosome partitioning protein
MAHVIAILNQKGGAGKSTLATNLARALQLRGMKTMIADADPQKTAIEWREAYDTTVGAAEATAEMPAVFGVDRDTFDADVRTIGQAFDIVIIDGAPRMSPRIEAALRVADLVLIPVQPSAFDVKATAPLVTMIERQRQYTPGRPRAAFVVWRQIPGTLLAGDVDEALRAYGLPVFEARASQRIAYQEAAGLGVGVQDYEPGGKAAAEVDAITDETLRMLHGEDEA